MQTSSAFLPHHCLSKGLRWRYLWARAQDTYIKLSTGLWAWPPESYKPTFGFFIKLMNRTYLSNFCLNQNIFFFFFCPGNKSLTMGKVTEKSFLDETWWFLSTGIQFIFIDMSLRKNCPCVNPVRADWCSDFFHLRWWWWCLVAKSYLTLLSSHGL